MESEELIENNQAPEENLVNTSSGENSTPSIGGDEENGEDVDNSEEEKYDDEGELSELTNDIEITGGTGHTTIVGSTVIYGSSVEEDDTIYPCPRCHSEIDASRYGKIICPNCDFVIYRRNLKIELEVTQFVTIKENILTLKYLDTIARINNNLIKRRFSESHKYCIEAELLAPREPTTWEYLTLVEFYHEISQPKEKRKDIDEILRLVRDNVKICEANGVDKEKIEAIKGEISIYLFNLAKSKIGQIYSKSKKQTGYWSKEGRHLTIHYLKFFEDCYRLTKDINYLKGYVEELSKPYKWIIMRSFSGELINLPSCGNRFNAVLLREAVIKRIEKTEPEYEAPKVAEERIILFTPQKTEK